jgi:hypothetical protein
MMVKPEPGIYRLCLSRLGVGPGEFEFLESGADSAARRLRRTLARKSKMW